MTTVMVVEDEAVVAADLAELVRSLGYGVAPPVGSGDEALRRLDEVAPDLVLMDVRLGGTMDGIGAAHAIRARRDVPIVYVTADADAQTVSRAQETEPFGYLLKPYGAREVRSAIEIALYKHQRERRLRERERWFATTLHSLGDAVVTTDAEGRVMFLNPAAVALTGATEAIGAPISEVVRLATPDGGAALEHPAHQALRTGVPVALTDTVALARPDGTSCRVEGSAVPIRDASGRQLGAVLTCRDVGEREQLQSRLLFAERMVAVGTLAAGVAHEVNNPLAYAMLNLGLAATAIARLADDADALGRRADAGTGLERPLRGHADALRGLREPIAMAREGAQRVSEIVRDLKTFARGDDGTPRPLDVRRVLATAVAMTSHEVGQRARLRTDYAEVPAVAAIDTRLGQVFVNLLLNAAQAIPEGAPERHEVYVRTRTDAHGRAVVEVCDTGVGVPAAVRARIFDPFFTTKPEGVGTGLGLAVCHGIVQALGGAIEVESEPGAGSTFRVVLPPAAPGAGSS